MNCYTLKLRHTGSSNHGRGGEGADGDAQPVLHDFDTARPDPISNGGGAIE